MMKIKRLLSMILTLTLALSLFSGAFTITAEADSGTWTEISDRNDLVDISGDGNYRLTADIDLAGDDWTPLSAFSGELDGNGHVIRNLSITDTTGDNKGLFASIGSGGKVYDLGIEGANITAGSNTGIIAAANAGTISRCYTTGTISGNEYVGGIVGTNETGSKIENCYSRASVSGTNYLGGLAGSNSGTVENCYAASTVTDSVLNNYLQFNAKGNNPGSYNSGGYVNIPHTDKYKTDAFTLEAWFQVDSTKLAFIISKSAADNTEWFEIHTNSDGLRFIPIQNGNISSDTNAYGGDSWIDVKDVLQDGWFHVAAVYWYDSSAQEAHAQVYVNGEAKDLWRIPSKDASAVNVGKTATIKRTTNPLEDANNKESINIGRRGDDSYYFNGKIADVRFWNTSRTAIQIKENKDKVLSGNETGLVGYWKLNETSGDAIDRSNTHNNGTVNGDITRFTASGSAAYKGALVGSGTVSNSNCFYDSTVYGSESGGAGSAQSTANMKFQSTYAGWDFDTIWKMGDNDYPNLGFKTVTSVTVTPGTISVDKGGTQSFSADVAGANSPAQTVTWSVEGNASSDTTISESGVLSISSDETSTTLTVRATSTDDTAKSGTAKVTVTTAPPVVVPYRSIQLGTGGINSPVNSGGTTAYHYVYFGNNSTTPIKWRVLDAAQGNAVGETDSLSDGTNTVPNSGAMFLLSENRFNDIGYAFGTSNTSVQYRDSLVQAGLEKGEKNLRETYFGVVEQGAMLATTKNDGNTDGVAPTDPILNGDKLFLISAAESKNTTYFPVINKDRAIDYQWWLRTPALRNRRNFVLCIDSSTGLEDFLYPDNSQTYLRPAYNLNKAGVLFSSAAAGGKSATDMGAALIAIPTGSSTEWKLTLLDNAADSGRESFAVSTESVTAPATGGSVSIAYTGAKAGTNEYLSAMIVDSSDNVLYYGRQKSIAENADTSGTQSIVIPAGLTAGSYTLRIFNEQYNGDYKTDYASAFEDVTFTVTSPVAFQTLTADGSDTASTTALTLNFDKDVEGLSADDITVTGATKGTLTKASGTGVYTLTISDITTADNGTVNVTVSKNGFSFTPANRDVTVRKYTPTYAVTYHANGGSGTMTNGTATQGIDFTLPACTFTAPTGKHFKEWAIGSADSITRVAAGATHSFTAATTVYAVWEANSYTVSYNGNSPTMAGIVTGVPAAANCTYDANFNLAAAPTLTGYTFGSWYKDPDCTEANRVGDAGASVRNLTAENNATVTLYAKWMANTNTAYAVEHYVMDTDGNYPTTATKTEHLTGTSDATLMLSQLKDTSLEVANGIVYSHGEVGEIEVTSTTVSPDGSRVIKLYYTRKQYTLTLAKGTGIESVGTTKQYYYGKSVTINANVSVGYTWEKWTSGNTTLLAGSTTKEYTFYMPAGDVTLTSSTTLNQYSVSYAASQHGSITGTTVANYLNAYNDMLVSDAGYALPAAITMTMGGSAFTDFTYNNTTGAITIAVNKVLGNLVISGECTLKDYTVTYDTNGGSAITPGSYDIEDTSFTLPTAPTKAGYTFTGWKVTSAATGGTGFALNAEFGAADTSVTLSGCYGNVTLTAQWTTSTYIVTYATDGGSAISAGSYDIEDASFTLPTAPTKTGYTFTGWKVTSAATGGTGFALDAEFDAAATSVTLSGCYGNVTLTAQWTANTYTVTYNNNGATTAHSGGDENFTIEDTTFTLPTAPTKTGYTFTGWKVTTGAAGGTGFALDDTFSGTTRTLSSSYGNVTLTAQWTANTNTAYTVEQYVMDTEGNYPTTATKTEHLTGTSDATLTLSQLKDTSLEVANGIVYSHGKVGEMEVTSTTVSPDGSRVIKLFYVRKQYTLRLAKGTGIESVGATEQYYYGKSVTINANVSVGYTWEKWTSGNTTLLAGSTTKEYTFYMPVGNITLTASATLNQYSVSYAVSQHGGITGTTVANYLNSYDDTLVPNAGYALPQSITMTMGNFDFTDFTYNSSTGVIAIAANKIEGNIVVIGSCALKDYTVTYDTNDGSAITPGSYDIEDAGFTLPTAPTKTGYTFTGWKVTSAATGGTGFALNVEFGAAATSVTLSGCYGNVTLTAQWTTDAYIVTYATDGGSTITAGSYDIEDASFTLPTAPTKTGYAFTGWKVTTDAAGGTGFALDDMFSGTTRTLSGCYGNVTLTAQWSANIYTVTYNNNGATTAHSGGDENFTIEDTTFTLPTAPTKTGYTFTGWKVTTGAAGGTGFALNDTFSGTTRTLSGCYGNVTLTAQWTADAYIVTYATDGGSTITAGSYDIEKTSFTLPTAPAKTGYTFAGWKVTTGAAGGTGFALDDTFSGTTRTLSGCYGNVTLTAQWTADAYIVTYATDGGSTITAGSYDIEKTSFALPTAPTKTGYTFAGWKVTTGAAGGTGFALDDMFSGTTRTLSSSYGNVTLTAQWTADAYTVTYNDNGATTAYSGGDESFTIETTVFVLPTAPTKTGYTFAGWKVTTGTAGGTGFALNDTFSGTTRTLSGCYGNVTLTAQWTADAYTVTYATDGGSTITAGSYDIEKTSFTLPTAPTKTGYTFAGWKVTTGAAGGTGFALDDTFSGTTRTLSGCYGNVTLTAQWSANIYTVTYNNNGATTAHSGGDENFTIEDTTFTLPTAPTKTGYTFTGWKVTTGAAGGTGFALNDTFSGTTRTLSGCYGNVTLTAQWTANTYTVTYHANSDKATGEMSDQTLTYDATAALTANSFANIGFTFSGWNTAADGAGTSYTDGESVKNLLIEQGDNLGFYAQWTANTNTAYTVEQYVMDTEGNYPTTATKTEHLTGTSDATLMLSQLKDTSLEVANGIVYSHGEVGEIEITSTTVSPDGSRVIKLYYTRKQYTLTLAKGTGIESVGTTKQYYYGKSVTINANVSVGYTWEKWTSGNTTLLAGSTTKEYTFYMPVGNITLTASATLNQYSVSYAVSQHGGITGTTVANYLNSYDDTLVPNAGYALPQSITMTMGNFDFTDFTYNSSTGVIAIAANKIEGNIVVIGSCALKDYTVTYDTNDGSAITPGSYDIEDTSFTLPTAPTKTGYTFTGWKVTTEAAGGTGFALDDTFSGTTRTLSGCYGNVTLTAQWTADAYTVTYATDGGSTITAGSYDIEKTSFTLPTAPTKTGYTFAGWKVTTAATGGTGFTLNDTFSGTTRTLSSCYGNVTLTAQWSANTYTVTYHANSDKATGEMSDQTLTYDATAALTVNSFANIGFTFSGWNTAADGKGSSYTDEQLVKNLLAEQGANLDFYAQWTEAKHHNLGGVVENDASPAEIVSGAAVELMQGADTIATTTTDSKGQYTFTNILPGIYNLVVTKADKTITMLYVVEKADVTQNYAQNVTISLTTTNSSTLTVTKDDYISEDVPKIVVGGLDTVASAKKKNITMTVTQKSEDKKNAVQTEILETANQRIGMYLDIQVNGGEITDTDTVLEIVVPYNFTDKTNVKVWRHHDTTVDEFDALKGKPTSAFADKTFFADKENNLLYIYASKFSTYAVSYTPVSSSATDYYMLTFATNGGSSISSVRCTEYTTVNLSSYTPTKEGYTFSGWYSDKGLTEKITSIRLTKNMTIYAGWTEKTITPEMPFVDVPEDAYYKDAVIWAVNEGITEGTSATIFSSYGICTRAQAAAFLWRANGSPTPKTTDMSFNDVPVGSYYYDAVLWAVEQGIIKGTSETTFSPDMNCSRAQIVTMLWRMEGSKAATAANSFVDVSGDAYYADAVLWAVDEEITVGTSATTFSPDDICTRAQIVTFIYRDMK